MATSSSAPALAHLARKLGVGGSNAISFKIELHEGRSSGRPPDCKEFVDTPSGTTSDGALIHRKLRESQTDDEYGVIAGGKVAMWEHLRRRRIQDDL